ncbi:MAG: DUF4271 domain-containing protein [Bacteroidetes bacterium]|nr:DUF4271 domain-containing protein [Bacteroidota bacterium]
MLIVAYNSIRWVENNDWVIFILLVCLFIYVFMLRTLNRDASLLEFITQPITEGANVLVNWLAVSVVYVLSFTVLVSQYVPIVPKWLAQYQVLGWQLNKFGFSLGVIFLFYLSKSFLTFLFYMSIGEGKRWSPLIFVATKFYFVCSFVLIIANIIHYYFGIDNKLVMQYYVLILVFLFVFKLFYYKFNKNITLPKDWYYKILYICTLQIIPLWVLWKILFI